MRLTNVRIIIIISWEISNSSFECRIRSRDLGHAHLAVVLWSGSSRGPSSMSAKFEADSSIRSKVIRGGGPKISKLGHVTLSHAPFEP